MHLGHFGKPGDYAHHKACSEITSRILQEGGMAKTSKFAMQFKKELWDLFLETKDFYYNSLAKSLT
jgi:hypothetical protein